MGREERQEQSKGIQLKPRAGRSWGLPGRALFTHLVPRRDNLLQALRDTLGKHGGVLLNLLVHSRWACRSKGPESSGSKATWPAASATTALTPPEHSCPRVTPQYPPTLSLQTPSWRPAFLPSASAGEPSDSTFQQLNPAPHGTEVPWRKDSELDMASGEPGSAQAPGRLDLDSTPKS